MELRWLVLVLALPTGACGGGGGSGTGSTDDHGDTTALATVIGLDQDVAGTIGAGGDRDVFRFVALAGSHTMTVALGSLEDSLLDLLDAGGQILETNDDAAPGERSSRIVRVLPAGTYHLRVRSYDPSGAGTYGVRVGSSAGGGGASGTGEFELAAELPAGPARTARDLTGDGRPDVIGSVPAGSSTALQVHVAQADGTYTVLPGTAGVDLGAGGALLVGDIDADGDLDVVAPRRQFAVYANDGAGRFGGPVRPAYPAGRSLLPTDLPWAMGDVDGDGDEDIVVADRTAGATEAAPGGIVRLLRAEGGAWTDEGAIFAFPASDSLHFASVPRLFLLDVTRDGRLDLIRCDYVFTLSGPAVTDPTGPEEGSIHVGIGDGRGGFTDNGFAFGSDRPTWQWIGADPAVTFGDIDRDGDPDCVVLGGARSLGGESFTTSARYEQVPIRVFRNNGSGIFTLASTVDRPDTSYFGTLAAVALGDFDGDGDADLAVSTEPTAEDRGLWILRNEAGSLGPWFADGSPQILPPDTVRQIAAARDMDADGDVDLVVSALVGGTPRIRVLRNRNP